MVAQVTGYSGIYSNRSLKRWWLMIVEDFHAEKAAELMISCGNEDEGGNFAIDISISHCWKHA